MISTVSKPTVINSVVVNPIVTNLANSTLKISPKYNFLIIGYGNDQRGDDAVGIQVAMTVANWQLPAVKSLVTHRLSPELAADMAQASHAIFVAALGKSCAQAVHIDPIDAGAPETGQMAAKTPTDTPAALLNLTQQVYGRHPQAWRLQIASDCFDWGSQLSSTAHQGCDRALRTIEQFFKTYRKPIDLKTP